MTVLEMNYRRRYPGAPPFADLPLHRKLFFGRGTDAKNLVDTILAESLVVVYARSGSGKTSLINVAVKEQLRAQGYAPLVVRIGKHDQEPMGAVFQGIAQSALEQGFEHNCKTDASLWHYFKTTEFWNGDTLLKPVLVIDQFEELFTLHSPAERHAFTRQLAHLLRGPAPALSRPLPADVGELTETPPPIKVVLSMREDFLALLDELVPDLPNIMATRFRLSAMDRTQATQAIEGPAGVTDADLESPSFTFTEGTVGKIIDFLAEGGTPDPIEPGGINPFQIQIVCQHVEDLVLKRARGRTAQGGAPIAISYEDLGGVAGLKETVSEFYERQLSGFNPYLRRRIQRLCEEGLANREGRRLPQEQSEIVNRFGVDTATLGSLVDLRLLQRERRLGGNHYELSHDTLLHPVLRARSRRAQRRRMVRLSAAIVVLAVAGVTLFWFYRNSELRREVADYVQRSYQNEGDSENRLIQAVAAVARSERVTSLDPAALKALAEASQAPTVIKTQLPRDVSHAALSPDGQIVALAKAGSLELRYANDHAFARALPPAFGAPVSLVVFAPQGDRLAAAAGRDVRVWDIAGRVLGQFSTAEPVSALAFDPRAEGPGLVVATNTGGWSTVVNKQNAWIVEPASGDSRPFLTSLIYSPDGQWMIGASQGATAYAWTRTGKLVRTVQVDAGLREWTSWTDAKTGRLKWIGTIAGGRVTLMDAEHKFESHALPLDEAGGSQATSAPSDTEANPRPVKIAFSADGKYLAVGTLGGETQVFQFDSQARRFVFRTRHRGQRQTPVSGLSWSPTDYHLLTQQEGGSTMRAIESAAPMSNTPSAPQRNDLARILRDAPVTRPFFALDAGGAVVTDWNDDWIKVIPSSVKEHNVFNPRVVPLGEHFLFATETRGEFLLRLWEPQGYDRVRWRGDWQQQVLRAAARTESGVLIVTTDQESRDDSAAYPGAGPAAARSAESPGIHLYRGTRAGGDLSTVTITGRPTAPITHVVAANGGNFHLMAADGSVLALSPAGVLAEVARVGGVPNVLFDQQGRFITWLQGGQPTKWDLPDERASPASTRNSPGGPPPGVSIRATTKVFAVQATLSLAEDQAVAVADEVGDVHLLDLNGTTLADHTLVKTRLRDVRQLAGTSVANLAVVTGNATDGLSLVHIRSRPDSHDSFDGSAIAIGDGGRFVAMLDPDKVNPEIRLSGADLAQNTTLFTFGGRCRPSAIAASPTSEVLIVGCQEGLLAAVTPTGAGLPHPEPAFDPELSDCWYGRPPDTDPNPETSVVALAFAPSGRFFVGAARHKVAVWNSDGKLLVKAITPTFQTKDDSITSIAVGPNDIVAIGTAKGTLILMTLVGASLSEKAEPLRPMMVSALTSVAFSPNGRQIVAGFDNGTIHAYARRWWGGAFSLAQTAMKADARVVSVAFSPDGERFGSGTAQGEVRLWSSSYEPLTAPVRLSRLPAGVAFSGDGRHLISSQDTTIEDALMAPTDAWMSNACLRLAPSQRLRESSTDPAVPIAREACERHWSARTSPESLVEAAAAGQIDVVEALIQRGVNLNAADASGRTPLMRALAEGEVAVATLLMQKNVDVAAKDAVGATALHHAASGDARSMVDALLDAGLPVDQADQNGRTPLMIAASHGNDNVAQALIDRKADVNLADEFGRTSLMSAAEENFVDVVRLLVRAGANVNARDRVRQSFGKTAVQLASLSRSQEAEDALLARGPDAPAHVASELTPLILLRLPLSMLASNDAQRQLASRLIAWRRGGVSPQDATALMRDLAAAAGAPGQKPDARNLILLGLARGFGVDGKSDWPSARQEFTRAAAAGSKLADSLLSVLMLEGLAEPQQFDEAIARMTRAAESIDADPFGAWLVGILYRDGYVRGAAEDLETDARRMLKTATEGAGAQFGPSWNSQAFMEINDPRRVERELKEPCAARVKSWLQAAADTQDVVAAGNLAEWAWYGRDASAVDKLKQSTRLAPMTLPLSMYQTRFEHLATLRIGLSYLHGAGVARNPAEALKWLTEAAAAGGFEANRELGRMYEAGIGVPASLGQAVTHYRRAAADGDVFSFNRLLALGYLP